jgi:hypothetical protein
LAHKGTNSVWLKAMLDFVNQSDAAASGDITLKR